MKCREDSNPGMPTPTETARALAAELRVVLAKYKASAFLTHKELQDKGVEFTLRIISPEAKVLSDELSKE